MDDVVGGAAPDQVLHGADILGVETGAHFVLGPGLGGVEPLEDLDAEPARALRQRRHGCRRRAAE